MPQHEARFWDLIHPTAGTLYRPSISYPHLGARVLLARLILTAGPCAPETFLGCSIAGSLSQHRQAGRQEGPIFSSAKFLYALPRLFGAGTWDQGTARQSNLREHIAWPGTVPVLSYHTYLRVRYCK